MNKSINITIFFLFSFFISNQYCTLPDKPTQIFKNKIRHDSYQDQVANGKIIFKGRVKYAKERLNAIQSIIDKYKRPITVLDIGAAQGYYSFQSAYKRKNDVYVLIEEDPYLLKLCKLNTELNNIIFLQKRIKIHELEELGKCEHFDVILALNIIHWSEDKWMQMTDAILNLGDKVIIETPPAGDTAIGKEYLGKIEKYLENKGAKIILKTPRHTGTGLLANMYLIENNKTKISKPFWNAKNSNFKYVIESSIKNKRLIKISQNNNVLEKSWLPGINTLTFISLNGVYPQISKIIKNIPYISLNNFILQGNKIKPIK